VKRTIMRSAAFGFMLALVCSASSWVVFNQEHAVRLAAICGTILGATIGARLLSAQGVVVIMCAFIGGIASIYITHHGKGALYGAPIGAIVGFVLITFVGLSRAVVRRGGTSGKDREPLDTHGSSGPPIFEQR
jgi:Mn2+/Fe2+ NRAMP family transporter